MNKEEAWLFIKQYTTGYYTVADHERFLDWLIVQSTREQELLLDEFSMYLEKELRGVIDPMKEENEALYDRIYQQISDHPLRDSPAMRNKTQPRPSWWFWRMAAALVIVVLTVFLYYQLSDKTSSLQPVVKTEQDQDVRPGGDKAVLTLGDGRRIVLDTAINGELARQEGAQLIKPADGQLTYQSMAANTANPVYNVVSTPRGGQYHIVLPDGSRVWLNAASFLRFPTVFTGNNRRVELQGEAYFDIAGNKEKPFQVVIPSTSGSDSVHIQVLGTRFNVNGYADEAVITTTLLDGGVAIEHAGQEQVLRAGQQAQVFAAGQFKVSSNADTSSVTAWKRGQFQFASSSIEPIMRQLARWYDVEIRYEGQVQDRFNATIARSVPLSKVLHLLAQTNEVRFTIEGRTIIVRP